MDTVNRFQSRLRRVSAAMRLPSFEDQHSGAEIEKNPYDLWGKDLPNRRSPQEDKDSSLESQFLSGDILHLPVAPAVSCKAQAPVRHDTECVLKGSEINDIPTSYVISGLRSGEVPVLGTYVDRRITPGFRYRVRLNQSDKYFFGGRPLHLEAIGSGYGKRLVFESTNKNQNENYFWSDSEPNGYGFKPVALWEGDRVTLTREIPGGGETSQEVHVIACVSQTEVDTKVIGKGEVEKRFQIKFLCCPVGSSEDDDRASLVVASTVLRKSSGQRRAKVEKVLMATQCSVRASCFARKTLP